MELDHSHLHEKGDTVRYGKLLTTYHVAHHIDQVLRSRTQNTSDNSDMTPEVEARAPADKNGLGLSVHDASTEIVQNLWQQLE